MALTANKVTLLRIILLPVPVAMLIYGDERWWWAAFVIFVFLGMTDFIDGWMARREGPTKLGSLLDPVADKIYIAAIFMTWTAWGVFPPLVISIILSRELFLTALRSSVAIRKGFVKTSILGKLKTVIQMGGSGTIFFTLLLSADHLFILCNILAIPFIALALMRLINKKSQVYWQLPVGIAFLSVAVLSKFVDAEFNLRFQIIVIILITWGSAAGYIIESLKLFKNSGILPGDWARLLWALTHGVFVVPLVAYYPAAVLPLLISISLEFGVGGIDNIVVSEKGIFAIWPFAVSLASGLIYSFIVNALIIAKSDILNPFFVSIALVAISSTICGAFFGRHSDLFKKVFS